ncbi:hypothetical protein Tco_0553234 [Tanacetum coccineum]
MGKMCTSEVRRTVADFLHVPPNEYSPNPNDKKQWSLVWFDFYKILMSHSPSWSSSSSSSSSSFISMIYWSLEVLPLHLQTMSAEEEREIGCVLARQFTKFTAMTTSIRHEIACFLARQYTYFAAMASVSCISISYLYVPIDCSNSDGPLQRWQDKHIMGVYMA